MDLSIPASCSSGKSFTASQRWELSSTRACVLVWHHMYVTCDLQSDKKLLLSFCTGSDRAPIKGLAALRIIVGRAGPDTEQ